MRYWFVRTGGTPWLPLKRIQLAFMAEFLMKTGFFSS